MHRAAPVLLFHVLRTHIAGSKTRGMASNALLSCASAVLPSPSSPSLAINVCARHTAMKVLNARSRVA